MPKDQFKIREEFTLVNCCNPKPGDPITAYHSHDNTIKIHRSDCPNLKSLDPDRLIEMKWDDVLEEEDFVPDDLYLELEDNDFRILELHLRVGLDYSHKVARMLYLPKEEVFERHQKLRDLGLLERVEPTMIRYRKGVVDNKWIKHRNHTYYDLTDRGRAYAEHYISKS